MQASFRHADLILAPSDELYARSDIFAARRVAIPNGVATDRFRPASDEAAEALCRRQWNLGPGPVVICARRFVPKCGIQHFVEALPAIVEAVPEVTVAFAGSGPLETPLRRRVRQLGVERNVRFLGPVPNERMPVLYRAGLVAVFPSLVEAVSIAALEAMSTGLAIVATRTGGLPQIVHDGQTGLLVPPADAHQMAQACIRLLRDPGWARRLGRNARAMVCAQYDWLRIAERTVAAYESVLAGPSRRRPRRCA